jgi:predicted DNA-binding antitoxin AbrB/MazE fold protein
MSITITAIYEQGVLRPLQPLALPENTAVEVRILERRTRSARASADRQAVYDALQDAGLIRSQHVREPVPTVSEKELAAVAAELAAAGLISDLIIAERAESY